MNDYNCSNTKNIIDKQDLIKVSKALGVDVDSNDGNKRSEKIDYAIGPPQLQNVSKSHIYLYYI